MQSTPLSTNGAFRFINGSPDVGPVDVYVDSIAGAATVKALAYGKVGEYLSEAPGPHNVWVYVAGASPATSSALISSQTFGAVTGRHVTVVLADNAAPVATPEAPTTYPAVKIHALTFTEPVYHSVTTGAATVHHASTQAPSPVFLYAYDANIASPSTGSLALALTTPGAIVPLGDVAFGKQARFLVLPALTDVFGSDGSAVPGWGFYAAATEGGAPAAFIYPQLVDPDNNYNGIPYRPDGVYKDWNFGVFAIDAPEGSASPVELIGAFDPNG